MRTYIRNCSHYMSQGHEAAVKSCFIDTSGNVAGTFIRSSQQGQNLFTHTHSQLQLLRVPGTCSRKVSHCLISSCHTISHRCFVTATCPVKVHLVELHAACCSNECCKKDVFLSCNSSGACARSLLRDLTNHRSKETAIKYFHAYVLAINTQLDENRWIVTLF